MSNIDSNDVVDKFSAMRSIFSKIIAGEIPCYRIMENERIFAFLDSYPVQRGHVLVVPKVEIDLFVDVPDEDYLEVFRASKIIARAQLKAYGTQRIYTKIEGFAVPHFHYHLIPVNTTEDILAPSMKLSEVQMQEDQAKILQFM